MKTRTLLLSSSLAIWLVGCLVLFSATRWQGGAGLLLRQLAAGAVGLSLGLALARLDLSRLRLLTWPLYGAGVISLGVVLVAGTSAKGAQRWLSLGPLGTIQPSEPMKLLLVLALAHLLTRFPARRANGFLLAWVLTGLAFLMVAAQPDLGTGLVLVAVAFGMLWVAGASPVYLAGVAVGGLGALTFVLKEYQRDRIMVFLHPDLDPMGQGYSLMQSLTAIGSGQLFGRGLFAGHLTQQGFVPENWTDFAFTVVGEELGLAGSLGLLLLCALQLGSLLVIAWRCQDYPRLLATGVAVMLGFQLSVNLAMTMGLAPVVGIPLPLVSYGGSALITNLAALGLVAGLARGCRPRQATVHPLPVRQRLPLAG